MNRYARIIDGIVIEVVDLPNSVSIDNVFPADMGFVAVPYETEAGMLVNGRGFVKPPLPEAPPAPDAVEKLSAFLSANPDVAGLIGS